VWSALQCTKDLQNKYHYQIIPYDAQQCGPSSGIKGVGTRD
jgi:hypothetical protein